MLHKIISSRVLRKKERTKATTNNNNNHPGEVRKTNFQSCHIILFKMSSLEQKYDEHAKKQESMTHTHTHTHTHTKLMLEIISEEDCMLDLLDRLQINF